MRKYLINIGNTHLQVGIMPDTGDTPELLARYTTEEIAQLGSIPCLDETEAAWQARAVCVVPRLKNILSLKYGQALRFLQWQHFQHLLDFSLVDTSTLGMDRIANAAAAFTLSRQHPSVVIDFGTCINTVAISATGTILGGAILPGRMLTRKALRLYTAQLPLIPLQQQTPSVLGTNTADAMSAGIDRGIIGAVRELLTETRALIGANCRFFPTGGDAPYFQQALNELLPESPAFLTLRGINTAGTADDTLPGGS